MGWRTKFIDSFFVGGSARGAATFLILSFAIPIRGVAMVRASQVAVIWRDCLHDKFSSTGTSPARSPNFIAPLLAASL